MKHTVTRVLAVLSLLCLLLAGCGSETPASSSAAAGGKSYKIGICNYVDDASLNQIVENLRAQLTALGSEKGVSFEVLYGNCNADANVLAQIIANFKVEKVDLMVAVATPVAMAMQAETEESGMPVVFAAVSDPVGCGLVESLEKPGANLTGTSDFLDTSAIVNLMLAQNPDMKSVGLLYDAGQDSGTAAIAEAKRLFGEKGIDIVEHSGTNVSEIILAAGAMAADKVDAVFTPTDNTVMTAELSIYETLIEAGIPHYTGADSFALNGAFVGYGVDYANLGARTADMVCDILVGGADPAVTAVRTFDNGTATVNTETCAKLGYDLTAIKAAFAPHCLRVQEIQTADSF